MIWVVVSELQLMLCECRAQHVPALPLLPEATWNVRIQAGVGQVHFQLIPSAHIPTGSERLLVCLPFPFRNV